MLPTLIPPKARMERARETHAVVAADFKLTEATELKGEK